MDLGEVSLRIGVSAVNTGGINRLWTLIPKWCHNREINYVGETGASCKNVQLKSPL